MAGNQYKADPRQLLFKEYYLDPTSNTFSNAYKSAIQAGYSEEYAKRIISDSQNNDWYSEIIRDHIMLQKAENNLLEFLEDNEDKRIKADITKFVAERLGKSKYSTRKELAGANGEPLSLNVSITAIDED